MIGGRLQEGLHLKPQHSANIIHRMDMNIQLYDTMHYNITHTHIYIYKCIHTNTCMHVYMHECMACMRAFEYVHVHIFAHMPCCLPG